jgi:hypothetical protein
MFDDTDIVLGEKSSEKIHGKSLGSGGDKGSSGGCQVGLGRRNSEAKPPLEQEIGKTTVLKHQEYGFNMV